MFVDGGPDAEVSREDIRQLRDAAASAGDSKQVELCTTALGEDDGDEHTAWIECASVIIGTRMSFAESV